MKPPLREGFTTGTAAAAAAKAATAVLLGNGPVTEVSVPLPPVSIPFDPANTATAAALPRLVIPVEQVSPGSSQSSASSGSPSTPGSSATTAKASVIKDGGDDPDATHGVRVVVEVTTAPPEAVAWSAADTYASPVATTGALPAFPPGLRGKAVHVPGFPNAITLYGGIGVGVVTLPGLPVAVGEPAINPEPRRQIAAAACEAAFAQGYTGPLHILVSVPEGAERANHTMNARLGILGGISILGTRGTVRPYSHDAWQATISQGFSVTAALGIQTVLLATGRRSEQLLFSLYPDLPPTAGIQVADFAAFSLREAALHPCTHIAWGCFPGKLLKLAQGLEWTHAKTARSDIPLLARYCKDAGAPAALCEKVHAIPTAVGAFALMAEHSQAIHDAVLHRLANDAYAVMQAWLHAACEAQAKSAAHASPLCPALTLHVFSMEGELLVSLGGVKSFS